jgi:Flp pilus assembly protein TadG
MRSLDEPPAAKLVRGVRRFWCDSDGMILPYVTILLGVIVGVGVLALDGARYMSLQTQLQQGADALALAGAAELDRLPASAQGGDDSISRATAAINNQTFVVNSTIFGTGSAANVQVSAVRFLSALPASDATNPIPASYVTTDPTQARFVEVTVRAVSINTILPASLFGGVNNLSTTAQAVAGFDQVECQYTPLYVCNPFETQGMTYAQASQALVNAAASGALGQRMLINLQGTQGNNGQYFPGNFGYLKPETGSLPSGTCGPQQGKSDSVVQAMALGRTNVCFRQSSVNFQTGNDQNVFDALDVRFDLWDGITGSFKHCSTDPNYPPDVNVRKGFIPGNGNSGACNTQQAPNWPPGTPGTSKYAAMGFPLDSNMLGDPTVTLGNGNWDCIDYWNTAHPAGTNGADKAPAGCTSSAIISRYQVYQYEKTNAYAADKSTGGEQGYGAFCSTTPPASNRRILHVAMLNCLNLQVNGNATNVPVAAFAKVFLTLPATSKTPPYAEFVGLDKPGQPNPEPFLYDQVQLYR